MMRKRDRTSEERAFDGMVKSGILRLGPAAQEQETHNAFPYVLFWDRLGRRGQKCRILKASGTLAKIEFECDGFVTSINRMAVRRL